MIEAARQANLVSIGGQLQFRFSFGICECYWVEVDTYETVPKSLPWDDRVAKTAKAALADFQALTVKYDFYTEGRDAFEAHFVQAELGGDDPRKAMWFVWYFDEIDNQIVPAQEHLS